MKTWIIYDTGFGNGKKVAESLANELEEYFDTNVGLMKKLDPELIVDEQPGMIIFGSPVRIGMLSCQTKFWIRKFEKSARNENKLPKYITAYSTGVSDQNFNRKWKKFFNRVFNLIKNTNVTMISNVLQLKVGDIQGPLETKFEEKIGSFANYIIKKVIETEQLVKDTVIV